MNKRLLWAAIAVGLLTPLAIVAQPVVQNQISGNEVFQTSQGVGGTGGFININSLRGSEPIVTQSGSGAATATAGPGSLCWVGTAPTTWAITLIAAPPDGTFVRLCNDTTLTTMVTVTAGTGDTLTTAFTSQTLTANTSFPSWQYKASTKIWYRIQ